MDLKVGLKIGSVELTFEGLAETFENKFEYAFRELLELGKSKFEPTPSDSQQHKKDSQLKPSMTTSMTVKAIAGKLGGDSGGALLYAAIASLAIFKKKETFTRQELLDEMKLAIGYYKPSYSANLTSYLDTLSKKGVILETEKDTYAVKTAALAELEQKLAQ